MRAQLSELEKKICKVKEQPKLAKFHVTFEIVTNPDDWEDMTYDDLTDRYMTGLIQQNLESVERALPFVDRYGSLNDEFSLVSVTKVEE